MTSAKTLQRSKPGQQVGIKDIAANLGVSIGTVDRALHGRPGVNPLTRDRVLKMAAKLGYRPNVAARFLKLNRTLRVAVLLPAEIATFFQPLREGIRAGASVWPDTGLEMHFEDYTRFGSGDVAMLQNSIGKHYDGIVCAPSDAGAATPLINQLQHEGTAVVCVATDAVRSERLASIAIDGYVSGSLAAELLRYALPPSATVGIFTGDLRVFDHSEKLRGYAASLALLAPHLRLLPVVESHDDPAQAYSMARKMLAEHRTMQGLYISTANSLPVLRAIREAGRLDSVRIVVTDLFPELVAEMENGYVMASLYQRPFTQGRIAIQSLLRYLRDNVRPARITKLAPNLVMRANLSIFSRYVEDPGSIPG
ncbi:MAG: LacI family DNA-binding transcriptional regulator [Acidobacteriota bacterium]